MESGKEQRISVKFSFKVEKTNGSNFLKMRQLQRMTLSGLADFQLQDPNLRLPRLKTLSMKIID
jgi:hypothetical protein